MAFQRKIRETPLTPDEALLQMEHFCAYRERCPQEVRAKLRALGMVGTDAAQIYEVLLEDGYFEEARFAVQYAGGKFRNHHWGRVRIGMELRRRDVDPAHIEKALCTIEEAEYEQVLQQWIAKKRAVFSNHTTDNPKIVASLLRLGFELELILSALQRG